MAGRNPGSSERTILSRLLDFVSACRQADVGGEYPHVGDIQWWFRDPSLEDPAKWRFWQDGRAADSAFCLVDGGELTYVIHPAHRSADLAEEIRAWGTGILAEAARQAGASGFTVREQVCDDAPAMIARLEREGFARRAQHTLRHRRSLDDVVPSPALPEGFVIHGAAGEADAGCRAELIREAFHPFTTMTMEKHLRVMRMPGYDPQLDLAAVSPDGCLAAGCICWLDLVSRLGLFEPVGTRPAFRRRGLARALLAEGLRRLQERGATAAFVSAGHPGDEEGSIPQAFAGARFVYQAAGFRVIRRVFTYSRRYSVA